MNFQRILANAVARRVAVLLVAAALAWLGLGRAEAHSIGCQVGSNCDQGQAYATLQPAPLDHCKEGWPTSNVEDVVITHSESAKRYTAAFKCRLPNGTLVASTTHFTVYTTMCSARPSYVGSSAPYSTHAGFAVPGSISCNNGCTQAWYNNGDGTFTGSYSGFSTACTTNELQANCGLLGGGYFWNSYAGVCQPPVPSCRADQTKNPVTGECEDACPAGMVVDASGACVSEKSECPPGNIKSPAGGCLPGEGQCAVGEVRRENGTCGKDADGDGIADVDDDDPDNDPKESASGGDTCDAPPACNGGPIDCMQVRIQWRIDCNTRRNRNISGGTCDAVPVCAGEKCDAMEYAQLLQQWKTTCALEKLANATPGDGGSPGGGSGAMDPVSSDGVLGDDADPSDVQRGAGGSSWDGPASDLELSESGYGFGRTCPTLPAVEVMGQTIQFDTTVFCDWMRLGGVFVMIMAHLAGLALVIRSV